METGRGKKILIVNGSHTNRNLLSKFLREQRYQVVAVATGEEAIPIVYRGILTNEPFQLVLLDSQMSDKSGLETLQELRNDLVTRNIKTFLFINHDQRERVPEFLDAGFSACVEKPVKKQELNIKIAKIFNEQDEEFSNERSDVLHILIADDEDLNQRTMEIVLSRFGHFIAQASNGLEVIEAVKFWDFDLVFMDVNMPLMDGLEATRYIRAFEKNLHRTMIVGLTATDLSQQIDLMFESGMDNYLPKPFNMSVIKQLLRVCQGNGTKVLIDREEQEMSQIAVLDIESAQSRFIDREHYFTLLSEFESSLSERLDRMQKMYTEKKWQDLATISHNLRGVAANFGAQQVSSLSYQLELWCNMGDDEMAEKTLHDLDNAVSVLRLKFLENIR